MVISRLEIRRLGAGLLGCAIALASCGGNTSDPARSTADAAGPSAMRDCRALQAAGTLEVSAAGIERTATVHMAPGAALDVTPLVIALHGYGGSGIELSLLPGFADAIDRAGFVAVFPDGLAGQWHFPGYTYSSIDPAAMREDRRFFDRLLDRLLTLECVDPERVYLVGVSMGGGMATEVSCRHADRIAGVGIVASEHFELPCPKAPPVAAISLHALDDEVLPYDGGRVAGTPDGFPSVRPIRDVVAAFVARNRCEGEPRSIERPPGTRRLSWTDCAQPVVHLQIARGRHEWFGVEERRSGVFATRELLSFLEDVRRR